MTSRRAILKAMALLPLATACRTTGPTSVTNFTPSGVPLRRVKVEDSRVIRTTAGYL